MILPKSWSLLQILVKIMRPPRGDSDSGILGFWSYLAPCREYVGSSQRACEFWDFLIILTTHILDSGSCNSGPCPKCADPCPCTPIERCRFLEDHVGPTCTWSKWLHDKVTGDHLDDADFFALGRCTLLGNGLSPRHFAAFSIGAGFVRDRRTLQKARHLLSRFRGGELRKYYDLSLQQVLPRSPPQEQEHWKPAFALLAVPTEQRSIS